ncbi:MAG: hypothetical protein QXP36_08000, partial [Conexivisphaerales archaeon]
LLQNIKINNATNIIPLNATLTVMKVSLNLKVMERLDMYPFMALRFRVPLLMKLKKNCRLDLTI